MTQVAQFHGWLHREANRILDLTSPLHDDLVQEGRIAMWKQEIKHGGPHAGFMTSQAALRMRQVAGGEKAFGGVRVAVRDVAPACSMDQFEPNVRAQMEPELADLAERAMLSYHYGEIHAAVDRLSPGQKAATRKILCDGVLTDRERASWTDARRKLATELDHLKGLL